MEKFPTRKIKFIKSSASNVERMPFCVQLCSFTLSAIYCITIIYSIPSFLIELTGASQSMYEDQSQWTPELDETTRAVTRDDIASLKSNLGSAVNESLLKKLQEINQVG